MPEFQEFANLGPDMMRGVTHVIECAFFLAAALMAMSRRGTL